MRSVGLIGSSKLTAKAAVIALVAGLLGTGVVVLGAAAPAHATSCGSGSSSSTYSGGDGLSTATAFRISTSADLVLLSNRTADFSRFFIQTANIDLGGCEWNPIGNNTAAFLGQYNGGGFAISGLSVSTLPTVSTSPIGLFGVVSNTVIRELTVRGTLSSSASFLGVGGLVGRVSGTTSLITQIQSEVNINYSGRDYAGGIVGSMENGTLSYSRYTGTLLSSNDGQIAGLSGYGQLSIISSYSRATFTGASIYKAGLHAWDNPRMTKSYSVGTGSDSGIANLGLTASSGNFWDTTVGVATASRTGALTGASGKTTVQMKELATYTAAGWDIVDGWEPFSSTSTPAKIWGICSRVNDGYPFLLWEYTTDPCTVTPPPSDSGSSSGSVYVAPVVVPEVVAPRTIRQPTVRQGTGDTPARLEGKSLGKDVIFLADSAKLSPAVKKTLRQAARLAIASGSKVAVTGFAALSSKGRSYEKSVAQRRALAVARYLRSQGVATDILYHGLSARAGLAFEGQPRRVEIRTLK